MKAVIWHSKVHKYFHERLVYLRVKCVNSLVISEVEIEIRKNVKKFFGIDPENGFCIYRYKEDVSLLLIRFWVHKSALKKSDKITFDVKNVLESSVFYIDEMDISWERNEPIMSDEGSSFFKKIEEIQYGDPEGPEYSTLTGDLVEGHFLYKEGKPDSDGFLKIFYILNPPPEGAIDAYNIDQVWDFLISQRDTSEKYGIYDLSVYRSRDNRFLVKAKSTGDYPAIEKFQTSLERLTKWPTARDICTQDATLFEASTVGILTLNTAKMPDKGDRDTIIKALPIIQDTNVCLDSKLVYTLSIKVLDMVRSMSRDDFVENSKYFQQLFAAIVVTKPKCTRLAMLEGNCGLYRVVAEAEILIREKILSSLSGDDDEILDKLNSYLAKIETGGDVTLSVKSLATIPLGVGLQLLRDSLIESQVSLLFENTELMRKLDLKKAPVKKKKKPSHDTISIDRLISKSELGGCADLRNRIMHCDNEDHYRGDGWAKIIDQAVSLIRIKKLASSEYEHLFDFNKIFN